ncbi:MAG TPA: CopG family ribbon-helix-helix protein [Candidatus Bathyarchaeia archaeon]|nr:CopG family ribbon-helix-helix protein [Candidatus Bathyarchaeia archaeon]
MTIISISLNKNILAEMDKIQKSLGFSGRSELIRAGIRSLLSEEKRRDNITGFIHALFLAIHDEKSDDQVTEMRHTFDKVINTHLHSKIDKDKCLEIFLLKGDATEINEMARQFQSNRNMDNVELVVT